jgi:beta-lactamase regulating signal transducer with metallopeptidase domain
MSTATITTWLLTYLAHSTILLGAAWLIARPLGDRRLALQEILLRTALVGGLLTATLQVGVGVEPVGGSFAIADLSPVEAIATSGDTTATASAGETSLSSTPTTHSPARGIWPVALLSLWGLGSMLALLALGRSILDLRRLLKTRRFRPPGRVLDRLATSMGLRRTVRLSTSPAIAVPFATGIRQPEICCPERVGDLAFEHQRSLFAHELAHLSRRDPAWQLLYRLGEAILFLQPLNRIVRRRLEEIAEHLTDERAVACTGDRLGLARCLVVVAHWGISDAPGVPATAFAAGPRLDRRVHHLISGASGHHRSARWTAPLLIALAVGSALLLPAIASTSVHADFSPVGSDVAPTQTWSSSVSNSEPKAPAAPAISAAPPARRAPRPAAPVTDAAPAPDVVPLSPTEPRPVSAPSPATEPAPATPPDSQAKPAPPGPPASPDPPSKADTPPPEEPSEREQARTGEEARARHREAQRRGYEIEARSRERARTLRAETRAQAEQARESTREAAERCRLTEGERTKLRDEARELRKQAEAEARADLRQARENMRLTDAEREELRRRAEELHGEARELARQNARQAREQSRELAERARRLAEEAEAERQIEEGRRREQPE